MPYSDALKYHEVTFKASHNSYDRDEPTLQQLAFHPEDPSRCGCRGLELDIWRHSDQQERFFTVSHSDPDGGNALSWYLKQLLSWHNNNPAHDVILVTLDIKSTHGDSHTFPNEIDNYLRTYFSPQIIFAPAGLYYDRNISLCENVVRFGWPQMSTLRGHFIFCLSGTEAWKNYYAQEPLSRCCFSDQDFDDDNINATPPRTGNFVFFNTHIWSDHYNTWKVTIPRFKAANMIVRAYEVDGETLWSRAKAAGVSALATNMVSGRSWARVGDSAFDRRL
jgi:hypothetical protein